MDDELNAKEVAFNKVTQWLNDYNFPPKNMVRQKDSNSQIQFQAEVYPLEAWNIFFTVRFVNVYKDSFFLNASVYYVKEHEESLKGLKKKDQDRFFIDIQRLVSGLHINCNIRFPEVDLYKIIFIDSLEDKQFFFDSIFDMINAMLLVQGKFDELYHTFFPTNDKSIQGS